MVLGFYHNGINMELLHLAAPGILSGLSVKAVLSEDSRTAIQLIVSPFTGQQNDYFLSNSSGRQDLLEGWLSQSAGRPP